MNQMLKNKSDGSYMTNKSYRIYWSYLGLICLISLITSVFPLLPTKQAQAAVLSRAPNNLGLVGYWPLDDASGTRAGDSSGNGNHGTTQNMEAGDWTAAKQRMGLALDGTNEYVEIPNSTSLEPTTAITVSAWVKTNSLTFTNSYETVIGHCRSGGAVNCQHSGYAVGSWSLTINSSGAASFSGYFTPGNHPTDFFASSTANGAIAVGQWYFLTGSYDGTNVKLYLNGTEVDSDPWSSRSIYYSGFSEAVRIGGLKDSAGDSPFNGIIDEPRLYSRALGPTEVSKLYQSGRAQLKTASNQNLLGYWSFDDGAGSIAGDSSSNGNDGDLTLMESGDWVAGKRGKALAFDGSNEFVNVGNSSIFDSAHVTASAWVNFNSTGINQYIIGKEGAVSPFGGWMLRINGLGDIDFSFGVGSTNYLTSTAVTFGTGSWNHFVGTYDGETSFLYLNGVQIATNTTPSGSLATNAVDVNIGRSTSWGRYLNGSIDEARVYGRALAPGEVTALYQLGANKISSSQNSAVTNGLVGCWSMNGPDTVWSSSTAGTVDDCSTNSNTGTLTNMERTDNIVPGRVGQALDFDGTNEYVTVSDHASLDLTTSMTLAGWIRIEDVPNAIGEWKTIVGKGRDSTSTYAYHLGTIGPAPYNRFDMSLYNGSDNPYAVSTTEFSANTWYHVVGTYDGANIRIFINGILEDTEPTTISPGAQTSALVLGARPNDTANVTGLLDGQLDEVRVYNRALTVDEVKQLYNLGR